MNHNDEKDPDMQEWHFILVCLDKDAYNEYQQDQKRHKAHTTKGRAQNEASEATKSIPRPKIIKISTRMLKYKRLNRMWMEYNLKQQLASLERE